MLSTEDNQLLTRTGPGTPMGSFMRRYWIPALLSSQLPEPDCPPIRVKLLSEQLVAFRDTSGQVGMLGLHCPHRGASLFFGRNEECGLRCVYHGWKFDVEGRCVDMPNEPPESNFKDKIQQLAYPCCERGGVVWTYMGPRQMQPEPPGLEWTAVSETQRYISKHVQECNWFQAVEGGYDNSHVRFLHRWDDPKRVLIPHFTPQVAARSVIEQEDYGFLFGNGREIEPGQWFWSLSQFVLPFHKNIPRFGGDAEAIGCHTWVPVDDEHCMTWSIEYHPDRPLTDAELELCRSCTWIHLENVPGSDATILNAGNDYLIDRELQRGEGKSYTGIKGTGAQDTAMQESQGAVFDRSQEHLGTADSAIIALRRYFLDALKDDSAEPAGLATACQRVRSAVFTIAADVSFAEAVRQAAYPAGSLGA